MKKSDLQSVINESLATIGFYRREIIRNVDREHKLCDEYINYAKGVIDGMISSLRLIRLYTDEPIFYRKLEIWK